MGRLRIYVNRFIQFLLNCLKSKPKYGSCGSYEDQHTWFKKGGHE
jgi:hypothetical protein